MNTKFLLRTFGAVVSLAVPALFAETGAVVGYVTLNIAAGKSSGPVVSTLSLPLYPPLTGSGAVVGRLTGVGASTLSNSAGAWTASAFSGAANPYFVKITSGSAQGRIFRITANTTNALTVDNLGTSLSTLGIVTGSTGDTYEIFPADTILSAFGTPTDGVLGGASGDVADQVQVYTQTGGWEIYYYNTTSNAWLSLDGGTNGNNHVLRPDEGIVFLRRATTPLEIVLTGRVPDTKSQTLVANSGTTALGSVWPVDTTLGASGINALSGWTTGSMTTADVVQIYSPTKGWRSFYHNGTNWVRVGLQANSDNEPIAAGTAIILAKRGSTAGATVLTQNQPYNLNN